MWGSWLGLGAVGKGAQRSQDLDWKGFGCILLTEGGPTWGLSG